MVFLNRAHHFATVLESIYCAVPYSLKTQARGRRGRGGGYYLATIKNQLQQAAQQNSPNTRGRGRRRARGRGRGQPGRQLQVAIPSAEVCTDGSPY